MSQTGKYSGGGSGGSGIITINGDVSSVTGNIVTFTGSSNGGVFTGNGTNTMTLSFNYLSLPASDASGNGALNIGGIPFARSYGTDNTFVGKNSGNLTLTTAQGNCGYGDDVLSDLTVGNFNCAFGHLSSASMVDGGFNLSAGSGALFNATSASRNISLGAGGNLGFLVDGIGNTSIGFGAGGSYGTNESYNITIGYNKQGTAGESNTLRIGNSAGVGGVTAAYIDGIYGITPGLGSPQTVIIDSNGQLGSTTTSFSGLPWQLDFGPISLMSQNNGYFSDSAGSPVTFMLPSTATLGSIVRIAGFNTGGWTIGQAAGQQIIFGNQSTTLGAAGSISSTNKNDCIELVCVTADTTFIVLSAVGNLMVV